jgi:hypothetical protein
VKKKERKKGQKECKNYNRKRGDKRRQRNS